MRAHYEAADLALQAAVLAHGIAEARSRARNEAILRLTRPCSLEYAGFGVVGRKNEQVDRRERRAGGEEGDATLLLSGQPWVTLIALALSGWLPRNGSGQSEVR